VPASANTATVAITPPQYYAPQPSPEQGDEGFSLQKFLRIIRRRQRTFIATVLLVTAASTAWLTYQRLVHPKYQGGFSMLIRDPVSPTTSAGQDGDQSGSGAIGAVALNRTGVDLFTLIKVLESPVVLEPVRRQVA